MVNKRRDGLLEFGKRAIEEVFRVDHEDKIFRRLEIMRHFIEANRFVNAATDAVAADGGFFDFFADHDRETLKTAGIFAMYQGDFRGADGSTVVIDVTHAAARMKPKFSR